MWKEPARASAACDEAVLGDRYVRRRVTLDRAR